MTARAVQYQNMAILEQNPEYFTGCLFIIEGSFPVAKSAWPPLHVENLSPDLPLFCKQKWHWFEGMFEFWWSEWKISQDMSKYCIETAMIFNLHY